MRRFVLGTAGHVDHGKTTLVRALTGVDTDRLPEEKRRGITIELGFAPWHLGEGIEVSVIDVPGHRRLVHTMIAGAIGMELVLLVVAADEGVMPQTREHVAACELLGIRRAVVAVTKVDRVGEEVAALAGEEAQELLKGRMQSEVVICSARTGQGVDAVRDAVRKALLSLAPPRPAAWSRLSVDRVFSVRGAGTVVTGTLVEGRIDVGSALRVAGACGSMETSARGLHVHEHAVSTAQAPTRLAINLAGCSLESVHRGDVITSDPSVLPSRAIDVALRPTGPVRRGMSVSIYVGTARSSGRLDILEELPDRSIVRLRLMRPLVVVGGDRFVLRGSDVEGPAGAVIGGGVVLDAHAPRQRARAARRAVLKALEQGDLRSAVRALSAEVAPRPLAHAALASRFVATASDLEKACAELGRQCELHPIKGVGFVLRAPLLDLAARARKLVAEHHKKAPLDRGLGLETLRQRLAEAAGTDVAAEAIRIAASKEPALQGEPIVMDGDVARLASAGGATVDQAVRGALDRAVRAVEEAGLRGVSEHAIGATTGSSPREVKAILAKLVRDRVALHAGDLWFSCSAVDELRAQVVAHFKQAEKLTIADFKALSGLGRKQAIPLLEQLDREGVTRRQGDDRVPGNLRK